MYITNRGSGHHNNIIIYTNMSGLNCVQFLISHQFCSLFHTQFQLIIKLCYETMLEMMNGHLIMHVCMTVM